MAILKRKGFKKDFLIFIIPVLLFLVFTPFLLAQSVEKALVIFIFLLLWFGLFLYTKNIIISSFLYILIVLPFNVTLQLPLVVEIFNTTFVLAQPFVEGIYVNYLVPTLSILDFGIFLVIISVLVKKGPSFYSDIFKDFKNGLVIFLLFLIIQNSILFSINSLVISLRIFLMLLMILVGIKIFKERIPQKEKVTTSILALFLFHVISQGVLGILQFTRGSHVGLSFLGESEVVSGMIGSSFIELSGQLFLRAYGTFPHPNVLGGFFLLSIFVGIVLLKREKILSLCLIGLSFLFLIFTFSRVGIFLGFLILLTFLIKKIFFRKKKKVTANGFTILLFFERFGNLLNGGDRSWSERIDLLGKSLVVFRENWFLGVGLGNFVKAMEGFLPRTSKGILLTQPVHNVFLLILSELGVLGFLSFFYVFIQILIKNLGKVTVVKFLIIFSLLVISLFDHYLFSLPQGVMMGGILFTLCCFDLEALD